MNILIGIIMIVVGALMVVYSEKLLNAFGSIPFFERYLGTEGGSRLGYKLLGLFVFFIGVLTMTGMIQGFILWVLSPILAPALRNI